MMTTEIPTPTSSPHRAELPALAVRGVGVSFRGIRALDAVSLDIPAGGTSAIIGPNGAGKTTLFNCISGLYRHAGQVELEGRSLTALRAHARSLAGIARTFQTPTLLPELDVMENVLLGAHGLMQAGMWAAALRLGRASRDERRVRLAAWDVMAPLGLQALATRQVGGLAHADRRRVEVARALLSRPRVLLLDEPAAGLSADEAEELLSTIAAFATESLMTSVLVEHDVGLVMRVAKFVAVLDAGKLLASGTPAEVSANHEVVTAYLGADADDDEALL